MITFIMVELEVAKISPLRCNFRNYALLLSVIVLMEGGIDTLVLVLHVVECY